MLGFLLAGKCLPEALLHARRDPGMNFLRTRTRVVIDLTTLDKNSCLIYLCLILNVPVPPYCASRRYLGHFIIFHEDSSRLHVFRRFHSEQIHMRVSSTRLVNVIRADKGCLLRSVLLGKDLIFQIECIERIRHCRHVLAELRRRRLCRMQILSPRETAERHLKCFLCLSLSAGPDRNHLASRTAQFLVFLQNGLDADDPILDMDLYFPQRK